jgi:hypothetical protein
MNTTSRFRILLSAALLCLGGVSFHAAAWSRLGHAMVGEIAQRHLDPKARAEVDRLLAGEPYPNLGGVASWADDLRNTDPELFRQTSRWHYINAKGGGCDFDLARDCPNGDCVVGAINKELAILGDPDQPLEARRNALKFVVHFVGDVHQPMHAGNRPDAGGNKYQISLRTQIQPEAYAAKNYVNGVMGTNLHAIWDYYILASKSLPVLDYIAQLDQALTPGPYKTPVAPDEPLTWAKESCQLIDAKGLYPPNNSHILTDAYLDSMRPLAEERVRLAGERLARLLNQTLGEGAHAR